MHSRKVNINLPDSFSPPSTESDHKPLARPAILGGGAMAKVDLPRDFDLTVHRQLRTSGNVKPVTRAELAERIELLKKKKHRLG
jgi:hypothetical protein